MPNTVRSYRSAAEIGRTELGPRPLPELAEQHASPPLAVADTVLDSGLRVLAVRKAAVPMVELRLLIPFAGNESRHCARAELLAETMLAGTGKRDRIAMDTDLAVIGGDLSTRVDPEYLIVSGSSLADGLPRLLEVLADALTDAAYRADVVDAERDRLVERITVARSQPAVIAREALQRHRYGDHPYAREIPHVEDVAALEGAEIVALHHNSVLARGSTLLLVGDIDPDAAIDAAARATAGWHADDAAHVLPPLPTLAGGDIELVHRPRAVQSQLRLSAQAIDRTDERYAALQLANLVYGGYFSSRLVENIREDKGYTYHARSGFEFTGNSATLLVDADTASEVTAAALLEIRYELAKLAIVPPNESELNTVRQYAIGSLLISTASQGGLAAQLSALLSVGLDVEWLLAHPRRLAEVTGEQVAAAAAEFFAPARFTGVVVGDADVIADKLATIGVRR